MHILVADDHNLVRDGLRPFLYELDQNAVILDAANFDDAFAAANAADVLDLVLLDLRMPGMNGLQGVVRMRQAHPTVPVVILSGHVERAEVMAAVRAGVAGYISKTISGAALIDALKQVLNGETYLPTGLFSKNNPIESLPPASPLASLSIREREILGHLIEGETNKEIARQLDLQEITIKIHLRNVYRKIGAVNRAQAVRIALSSGWPIPMSL
ncbi:response regulator transcription factor [Telmatospirillum sp.]|uniref:response regulator transcription factor n=1 Tax=Telmatospirillum sp. TaxID=2079197 RepID=UPI00284727E6|nr:response regulator transcription factor [Telmatospirillum sp.]MDR3440062.1 response regulator transcription factor [Telmatospirillum sp.]